MELGDGCFRTEQVGPISAELIGDVRKWEARFGLPSAVDETWLELRCLDDVEFTEDEQVFVLAAPPAELSVGDRVDARAAEHIATRLPSMEEAEERVPEYLAVARELRDATDGWVAVCELPVDGHLVFEVDDASRFAAVFLAVSRALLGAPVCVCSSATDVIRILGSFRGATACGSVTATVGSPFAVWPESITTNRYLRGATHLVGALDDAGSLILTAQPREPLFITCGAASEPIPECRPADHFASAAKGNVAALRVDRPGGLGPDALALVTEWRHSKWVVFQVDDDARLLIGSAPNEPALIIDAPGFTTLHGIRNQPFVLPYPAALVLVQNAATGVDVLADDQYGRLLRPDVDVVLDWTRPDPQDSAARRRR